MGVIVVVVMFLVIGVVVVMFLVIVVVVVMFLVIDSVVLPVLVHLLTAAWDKLATHTVTRLRMWRPPRPTMTLCVDLLASCWLHKRGENSHSSTPRCPEHHGVFKICKKFI